MERIGSYTLKRRIVDTPTGQVHEAEQADSARPVLLEVLREELAGKDGLRQRLADEIGRARRLSHANIVRCMAHLDADGRLAVISDAKQGRSLRRVLDDGGRLSWEEAAHVALGVARALAAAHGAEPAVLHRELRPERVFVLTDGTAAVLGFGVAAAVEAEGGPAARTVEMLRYLSPEQVDAGSVDERSDLYGLGLLLYELLAGHPPFQSSSMRTLANMQCTEAPVPLPATVRECLPKGLHELLLALLEKEPGARPQRASEVAERLEAFASDRARTLMAGRLSAPSTRARSRSEPPRDRSTPAARRPEDGPQQRIHAVRSSSRPAGPAEPAASAGSAARPSAGRPSSVSRDEPAADATAGGVLRRVRWPRQLSTRQALVIVVVFTVLAALTAYGFRACGTTEPRPPAPYEYEMEPPPRPLQTVPPPSR